MQLGPSQWLRARAATASVHVDDAEREVVHDAGLVERWVGAVVEHVFEPVGAVGDLEADPVVDVVGFGAAVPVGAEAEDAAARTHLLLRGRRP